MGTKKEQWINERMESMEGMERATPPPFLYTRIHQRLRSDEQHALPKLAWPVMAVLLLLFFINLFMIRNIEQVDNEFQLSYDDEIETLMEEYDLFITSNLEE